MNHNSVLKHRLDTSFFQIIEITLPTRGDIMQMWRTARLQFDLMDQELVQCRRANKFTPKYIKQEQILLEILDTIEQHITFATLLTPNHN